MAAKQARMSVDVDMLKQFIEAELQMDETERSLARKSGLSHTTIQRFRVARGKKTVNILTARKLERALSVPPNTIFKPLLPEASNATSAA